MASEFRSTLRARPDQQVLLGRAIAAARVLKGLEIADLAKAVGRSKAWVSRLEDGHLGLSAFEYARIAKLLGIPPHVLDEIAWRGIPEPELPDREPGVRSPRPKGKSGARPPRPEG